MTPIRNAAVRLRALISERDDQIETAHGKRKRSRLALLSAERRSLVLALDVVEAEHAREAATRTWGGDRGRKVWSGYVEMDGRDERPEDVGWASPVPTTPLGAARTVGTATPIMEVKWERA